MKLPYFFVCVYIYSIALPVSHIAHFERLTTSLHVSRTRFCPASIYIIISQEGFSCLLIFIAWRTKTISLKRRRQLIARPPPKRAARSIPHVNSPSEIQCLLYKLSMGLKHLGFSRLSLLSCLSLINCLQCVKRFHTLSLEIGGSLLRAC